MSTLSTLSCKDLEKCWVKVQDIYVATHVDKAAHMSKALRKLLQSVTGASTDHDVDTLATSCDGDSTCQCLTVGVEDLFNTVKFYNSSLPFVKYQLLIEAV